MKKRSLVAALAMLVVSAIVLTSSTYAWFAASSQANVSSFSATVSNNSGNLTVKATGTEAVENAAAKPTITADDYQTNSLCKTLSPVSLYVGTDGPVLNKVTYKNGEYTGIDAASRNQDYLCYEFQLSHISADGDAGGKNIELTPTISTLGKEFCYALVVVETEAGTSYYRYGSVDYVPVKKITAEKIVDVNGNDIIDAADTGYAEADMASADANETLEKAATAITGNGITIMQTKANGGTATADITVYAWAEGQDPQCSGPVSGTSIAISFVATVAA